MTVLIADDDKNIITALKLLLDAEGLESVACSTPGDAYTQIQNQSFQLALIDLNYREDTTSGKEGLELISLIREVDQELPIIVMTGWGTVNVAVEAMKRGAMDFIEKPWDDNNRLVNAIRTQIMLGETAKKEIKLSAENKILRQESNNADKFICESPVMQQLMVMARRVAGSDIPILITGENGSGKSLLASYIHSQSATPEGPFISVNMGGISDSTFESEMFGHVPGAYTDAKKGRIGRVELADKGTLFMDEIANMPLQQQAKILRLLEEHKFERLGSSQTQSASVRIISATNANLNQLIADQHFREDLLFRLNGITLELPPLRSRAEDIVPMAKSFLRDALAHYESTVETFSAEVITQLQQYSWPGNVRELQHVVERSVLLCQQSEIMPEDLQLPVNASFSSTPGSVAGERPGELLQMTLEDAEAWFIRQVLHEHDGNATNAAKALGISRSALYRRIGKVR